MSRLEKQICTLYDLYKIASNPKVRAFTLQQMVSVVEKRRALTALTVKAR